MTERLAIAAHEIGVPVHLTEGLIRYIDQGVPTGSFLEAVLSNDLMDAMARADVANRYRVFEIAAFLHSYAPRGCYGSRDNVREWIEHRGLAGLHPRPVEDA